MKLVSALYDDAGPFMEIPGVDEFSVVSYPSELEKGDILLLHGGSDISPSLYKHSVSSMTSAYDKPSKRDILEWALIQSAIQKDVPIIGICRGLQMLCAAAGGYLIQHVDNHSGYHTVTDVDGNEFEVNSIHHQMVYPFDVPHELVAWSTKKRSKRHIVQNEVSITDQLTCEPEAVIFPKIRAIGFQWHPEMGYSDDYFVKWSVEQATKFIYR